MRRLSGKVLAMLLAVAMVFGLSGMTAFGAQEEEGTPVPLADTEEYNVKYAVCIWGINQDVDESGYTLGLTFGPATGKDYRDTYEAHISQEEYEAGGVCLHWMSWEEIARQCRIDPTVFQDCLEYGCTHSVNLMLNNNVLDTSYAGMMEGDGVSTLRYSIQDKRRYWNVGQRNSSYVNGYSPSSTNGYPGSQVRAVLVGKDNLSKSVQDNMLEDYNCLYSCFPVELQDAIVAKEVDSYSSYNMKDSDSQIVYDKLWLFSGKEIFVESGAFEDAVIHDLEGNLYQRSQILGITAPYNTQSVLPCYNEEGAKNSWWTRSMTQSDNTQVYLIVGTGVPSAYDTTNSNVGLSPGFCFAGPAVRTDLIAAIETAETLDESSYTPKSWAAFQEALDNARSILNKEDATQKEVDDATLALQEAMDSLEGPANKTALEEAIAEAEALDEDDYTPNSWAVLEEALESAKTLRDDENATQTEVNNAWEALREALDSLVVVSDKAELETVIAEAEALDESAYTAESWAALEEALTAARETDADRNATPAAVKEAADDLVAAIASLERADGQTVDKADLLSAYLEGRELAQSDYRASTWEPFATALSDAQEVLLKQDATQTEVEEALAALQSARDGLIKLADKTELEAAIAEANALNEEDYTPTSWAVLEQALAAAEAVVDDPEASVEEAEEALLALQTAMSDLVGRADKTDLEAAIETVANLDASSYTEDSWTAVEEALAAASEVDADGDATQSMVDETTVKLVTAVAGLKPLDDEADMADKEALLDEYVAAKDLSRIDYSPSSWAVLQSALSAAQEVLLDVNASQDAVDAALDKLIDARDNLISSVMVAFAVYSGDDNSLTFYTDSETLVPAEGESYNGKEATNVYMGVDSVNAVGTSGIPWYGVRQTTTSVVIDPSFAEAQPVSLAFWFDNFQRASFSGMEYIDTSNVTSTREMFYNCISLTSVDLTSWDTSNMTAFNNMFWQCSAMESVGDLSGWDTSNVTTLRGMFYDCPALTSVDMTGWDTSNVTTMQYLFRECTSLESVGDLSDWDTGNVTTMEQTFCNCTSLADVDVADWDTSNVTDMSYAFFDCASFSNLDLSGWDTTSVYINDYFAYECPSLEWVKIGEATDIFRKGRCITQQNWYDASVDGNLVSSNYLIDVEEPGQYWTYTTGHPTVSGMKITSTLTGSSKTYDGNGFTLTAEAAIMPDTAQVTWQWYKDDAALDGETGSSLAIDGNVADTGTYKCVLTAVSEGMSTQDSAEIAITINAASQNIAFTSSMLAKTTTDAAFTNPLTETKVSTEAGAGITYKSSDTSVATVDSTGKVTILAAGTTTITATAAATANYKEATASYMLSVTKAESSGTGSTADKSALQSEYNAASKLSESDYTAASWKPFVEALAAAKTVLDNSNATQTQVDEALLALQSAQKALVKATGSGTSSNKLNGLNKVNGTWGYYKDGTVDKSYTGFAHNDNGDWYVVNGYVRFDQNTVAKDTTGKNGDKGVGEKGTWYYVVGNKVQSGFTGLANYKNENGWWYIKDGVVDFTHNGVDKNKNGWYYVTGGKVQFGFTGLANYKNQNGWWYIAGGKVDFTHNGVDKNKNGWWYVTGGKVRFGYTGLANYRNANGWWVVRNGKVDFTFNGVASNKNGTWYISGGKVDFSYSGRVTTTSGRTYNVSKGKVT